jgi:hypothetical protein
MARYHFTTYWTFDHPVDIVWETIRQMDHWPEWWKYVKSVKKLRDGDENEIGSIRRICWETALPYTIMFDSELTLLERYSRMEGIAYGDLTGSGVWIFSVKNGSTRVRYDWNVEVTKKWMKYFDFIARPVFKWNHDKVMRAGYEGLSQKLQSSSRIFQE